MTAPVEDPWIVLGPGATAVPESLLMAHARGKVLFIAGAGASMPSNLPSFQGLALGVYADLDKTLHAVLKRAVKEKIKSEELDTKNLTPKEVAEARRFLDEEYDVALGMLERRIDDVPSGRSKVRHSVMDALRRPDPRPAPIHRALMRLADRGGATTIATTNFDLLLEDAGRPSSPKPQTYALGGIPRPSLGPEFSGVLHIHGALDRDRSRTSDLVVTDQDLGEYYLRRGIVPDFIHDAARLFHLVLVGYSANDPPMRYLLNAVAADGNRFSDLKERYVFFGHQGVLDEADMEDWRGRGITPIPYNEENGHAALRVTLELWATLSAINGSPASFERTLRRIVRVPRGQSSVQDRDLFDHLFRRLDSSECARFSALISRAKADLSWLDAIAEATRRPGPGWVR